MQVEQIRSENLKHEYNITVPAQTIATQIETRLNEIGKTVKMPGFRPGKIPMDILKRNYGKNVMGEVLEKVVETTSGEALEKEGLRPAMQPKIEILDYDDGKDLKFKIEFEILPEVPEVKLEELTVIQPKIEISDSDIDEALQTVAQQNKDLTTVDRPAANGDAVLIDFKGFTGDEAFDGGEGTDYALNLGSNTFIPGFEDQLVGTKAGDKKDVIVTFPEEYHSKDLAGKEARFEVTVKEVQEGKEAEINDALAEKLGLESLEKLKEIIRSQLESELGSVTRSRIKKSLFDALDTHCTFDIPEEMFNLEFDSIWKQVQEAKETDPESDEFKGSEEELKKEYEEMARRRVRLGIYLSDYGNKQDVSISQTELQSAVMTEARRFPGQEQQVVDYYLKNPQYLETLKGPILEEKVVDFILEKVKVEEKLTTIEELKEQDE